MAYELDPLARGPLKDILDRFRERLLLEAASVAPGRPIEADALERAFHALIGAGRATLEETQSIISSALRENRPGEWIAYGMAVAFFGFGLILIGVATWRDQTAGIIGGTIADLICFIPLKFAINIRRHNLAIRVLGKLLDRVKDPKILASILRETFPGVVANDLGSGRSSPER